MPRLPDVDSLPGRARPRPSSPEVAGPLRSSLAASVATAAETGRPQAMLANVAAEVAQADLRVQSREDTIGRAHAIQQFQQSASERLTKMQTESDLSRFETGKEYATFLRDLRGSIMEGHGGSADSRAMLAAQLEFSQGAYLGELTSATLRAQDALVKSTLDSGLNTLVSQVYDAPGRLPDQFEVLERQIGSMAGALTPEQERAFRTIGRQEIGVTAVRSYLDRGQIEEASSLLASIGGGVLAPEKRRQLEGEIAQFQQAQANARLAALQGGGPTDLVQELMLAGLQPGTPEFKQAILAARAKPLVSINQTQPFGQASAEQRQGAALEAAGVAAGTKVASRRLGDLLAEGTATGPLESGKTLLRALAADTGVSIDEEALGRAQEFDRVSKDITLNSMQRFKGAMSERELDFGISTVANLGKSEEGNVRAIAALQAAAEIALENAQRLGAAGDFESFRVIEQEILGRSADDIKTRTAEIETELRARVATTTGAVTVPTVQAMTPEQARQYIERRSAAELDSLPPEVRRALAGKLQ